MRKDYENALKLRRVGYSYNFINAKLGVPKSTLSEWFSDKPWSSQIKEKLAREAFRRVFPKFQKMVLMNKRKWDLWRKKAREEAAREFKKYRNDILFCKGVMLYWGEGDRNPKNPVRVSNVDPLLLRIFVEFLKKYGQLSTRKIKAHLILYPDLEENFCKRYWSGKIKISTTYFNKTQHIIGKSKRRLPYGIGVVSVSSGQLKEKILTWIKLYAYERS